MRGEFVLFALHVASRITLETLKFNLPFFVIGLAHIAIVGTMAGKKRSLVTKTSPAKKNPRISKTPDEELVPLTIHIPKQHLAAFQAADMDDVIEFVNRGDIVKKLTQENNLHPIAEKIFQMLDQKSIVQARGVSRTWKNYVDNETSFWDRLPSTKYFKAVKYERLDIIQNLVDYAKDNNPCDPYSEFICH